MNPYAPPLAPPPRARPAPPAAARRLPRLGWLEAVVLGQTLLPALMFVPPLLRFRFATRALSYALPLAAWAAYAAAGRRGAGGRLYPPVPFLAFAAAWLAVSIVNPGVNTTASALCEVALAVGVLCPAFWAPAAVRDPRQLGRLMILLLACNGASTLMGIAQVYRPATFRPPKIAMFEGREGVERGMTIEMADGRKFLRPPGLTDTPGGAAIGGQAAFAIGLALAMRPGRWWARGAGLGLALAGLAIIFYSQVRVMLITLALGVMAWAALLALRREARQLATLAALGAALALGAVGWVLTSGGMPVLRRFAALWDEGVSITTYNKHRGAFIDFAFQEYLPRYPLGAGPGRAGMAQALFGNPIAPIDRAPIYAETQVEVWILDGGWPLLIAYALALAVALGSAALTALRCPDREVAAWAGAVVVCGVATAAAALGSQAFLSPMGVQFWALFGALYGAERAARAGAKSP